MRNWRTLILMISMLSLFAAACGGAEDGAEEVASDAAGAADTAASEVEEETSEPASEMASEMASEDMASEMASEDMASEMGSEMSESTEGSGGAASLEGLSGTLAGAGASSQTAAVQAWQAGVSELNPDVTINYDPVGSGGGRDQFVAGGVPFAGSDAYLDEEELAASEEVCLGEPAVDLPLYIAPIALVFNLPEIDSLNLQPQTIADIFNQQIANWNDPAIAEDNPDVTLPDLPITPVNRSDESGTTENFVDYLSRTTDWEYEVSGDWPVSGGEAAQGTSGVVAAVTQGEGAIGYADASQAGDLGTVAVGVGEEFVEYSPEAAAAVVDASPRAEGRGENDIAIDLARDTTESGVYPIVLISYHVICQAYEDESTVDLLKGYLSYVVSEEGQQAAAENAGSAPISDDLRTEVEAVIEGITVGS